MTRFCLSLLAILAVASAFTTPLPSATTTSSSRTSSKPLFMFSAEDGKASSSSPLTEVKPGETADVLTSSSASTLDDSQFTSPLPPSKPTMLAKNRNTGEMVEVEINESFLANERMEMSWWAWTGFVIFPITLLTNDVFHFLPTDGPLGFLGRF